MKTIEPSLSLEDIKTSVEKSVGKNIKIVELNKQGKILHQFVGEIISVYACLFIVRVKIKDNYINKSFSYIDFLTKDLIFEII